MKTIVEKLNLNKFGAKLVVGKPDETYLTDLELGLGSAPYDLIFAFANSKADFVKIYQENSVLLAPEGLLYMAYPKKGNKKFDSYVHRDELFELLGADSETGFVVDTALKFNRMVALDDIYTVVGIKNAVKEKGKVAKSSVPSGRVADYIEKIPELRALLAKEAVAAEFFEKLTPGYQKDWARYIYSSKTEATQQKHIDEMFAAFATGYKTADQYKKAGK